MIVHLVNGSKITIPEENCDDYINVVEFGSLISINQRAREENTMALKMSGRDSLSIKISSCSLNMKMKNVS